MKPFRSFIPPLAVMLMAASGGASAQGVLIERSEIRFVGKQTRGAVEGKFRKWKANVDFRPKELAKSKADFEIELASIDLANEETEAEVRRPVWFDTAKISGRAVHVERDEGPRPRPLRDRGPAVDQGRDPRRRHPDGRSRKDAAGNSVAEGQFAFNRLDFRIGDGLWADTGTVADEVGVRIRMVLPPVA